MQYVVNAYKYSSKKTVFAIFTVQENKGNGLFYAKAAAYGCSNDCKTPQDAIHSLLSKSGCYAVTINKA